MMINTRKPGWEDAHAQAREFATLLGEKGFVTIIHNSRGHRYHPCIEIAAGRWRLAPLTDYIYLAPDDNGVWWFWWSTLEPIAPAEEVSTAAAKVARAIAAVPKVGVRVL